MIENQNKRENMEIKEICTYLNLHLYFGGAVTACWKIKRYGVL